MALINPQDSCTFPGPHLPLLLVALFKRCCALVVSPNIVQVLHFVDADDPVLARESLLEYAQLGTLSRKSRASDTILCLTRWE